jgi:hypothetical protein
MMLSIVSVMSGDTELVTNAVTELVTTHALYSESSDFKSQPRDQLSIMRFFCSILQFMQTYASIVPEMRP